MKTGRTIQEMAVEIMRQSKAKEDYLVNTGSLVMEVWDGQPMLHLRDAGGSELVDPLDIQSTAHQQIGDYLEIPRKYYRRMLGEDAELLAYNVNRWFQQKPEQRMIRTMDGRARAFLSNRYRRIDNLDIATITLPIIGEMKDVSRNRGCLHQVRPCLHPGGGNPHFSDEHGGGGPCLRVPEGAPLHNISRPPPCMQALPIFGIPGWFGRKVPLASAKTRSMVSFRRL